GQQLIIFLVADRRRYRRRWLDRGRRFPRGRLGLQLVPKVRQGEGLAGKLLASLPFAFLPWVDRGVLTKLDRPDQGGHLGMQPRPVGRRGCRRRQEKAPRQPQPVPVLSGIINDDQWVRRWRRK